MQHIRVEARSLLYDYTDTKVTGLVPVERLRAALSPIGGEGDA